MAPNRAARAYRYWLIPRRLMPPHLGADYSFHSAVGSPRILPLYLSSHATRRLNTHNNMPIFGRKLQKIDETGTTLPWWAQSDVFSKRRK